MTWNADGSPATVNEGSDTLTYVYDTAGRVTQLKRSATVLTSYTYTLDTSTIATRTDGTQGATAFTYDWARRQTVIDPPDAFVASTVTRTYRLDGLLATQSFPSSITETLAYDALKRPTSIALGGSNSLSQTFDRAGRVTSDGRSLTGFSGDAGTGTQSFTYDAASRLTGSTGLAINRSYQYDLDGNRTQRIEGATTTTFTYDRADQLATQVIATTETFDYDRYGNLLSGWDAAAAQTTYAYDEASRLTTISPPGGASAQVTFTLDALDRHASRLVNNVTTDTYQYLDATETAWQTGTGTPTSSLLDAAGSRLAIKTNTTVSWLIFDLHGSVTALCSTTGTITDAYRFDGFGQQIAPTSGGTTNPWRFRGLLNIGADTLTGALVDMGARDYSPQLGVFTQQDSVQGAAANPMTMNRFLYALANPATLIDPDGHRPLAACDRDCGADYNTSNDIQLWQTNQQHEIKKQKRIDKQREEAGCRKSGICRDMEGAPPPGYHWSSFFINGQPTLLPDGWCAGGGGDSADDCSRLDPLGTADTLSTWVLAGAEGAKGSREWVSQLARCLRECTDAAARSRAGSLLQSAGRATAFGNSAFYKRWAGRLPAIGFGVELGLNVAEGQDPVEATIRAGGSTAGSIAGVSLVMGICGFGGLLTGGLAAAGCLLVAAAASWKFGEAGDEIGGAIYDQIDQP